MSLFKSMLGAAKRFAARLIQSTAPQKAPLRLNPMEAFKPQRDRLGGLQIRWAKTRPHNGITYRAGRSKYAPQELKDACTAARARLIRGWLPGEPYAR